jgi:hypothetical protein
VRTTRAGQSALLLLDAVAVLATRKIPYAVIGAMAASVHGIVRASMDADAVLSLTIQETPRLEREFRAAGFQTAVRKGDPDDPIAGVLSLTDVCKNRVDLLVGLRGLDPGAFSRSVELIFHGVALRVIGLEDFIAMKIFAGGPQDLADARAAIMAAGERLNQPLAKSLAQRFGQDVAATLERLVAENGIKERLC